MAYCKSAFWRDAHSTFHTHIYITQYGSTVYLGMTRVVSGQFQHVENTRRSITAKRNREEPK